MNNTTKTAQKPAAKANKAPSREEKAEFVKAEVEKMMNNIEARVEQLANVLNLGSSEEFLAYLKFTATFYKYSFGNQLLIQLQAPEAKWVASYKAWQEKGRQVVKGAKSIKILAPLLVNDKDAPCTKDGSYQKKLIGFKYVPVFPDSATEGEALPDDGFMTVSGGDERLLAELSRVAESFKVPTVWQDCGGAHGMTDGSKIYLDPVRCAEAPAHAFRVWLHEAAHVVLHFQDDGKRPEDLPDREQRELEADATAYVLGTFWGIEQAQKSADYIRCWGGNAAKLRASLNRIQKAVKVIMDAIEGEATALDESEEAQAESA